MPRRKGAHLTYEDRCIIEDMLKHGSSFREIARRLNVSPTTVSGEVRRNRMRRRPAHFLFDRARKCIHYRSCERRGVCGSCTTPQKLCKTCLSEDCCSFCKLFEMKGCPRLEKAPYVCNFCVRSSICELGRAYYLARDAQAKHDSRASCTHASHAGPTSSKGWSMQCDACSSKATASKRYGQLTGRASRSLQGPSTPIWTKG